MQLELKQNADDMSNSISFTEPTLCHYNHDLNRSWFVYFDVKNKITGEILRQQYRGKINRRKTLPERLQEAQILIDFYKNGIKKGWNPFNQEEEVPEVLRMSFNEALDFGLSKCKIASKSYQGYKSTLGFIKSAAIELKLSKVPISDIKRLHIKLILEKGQIVNNWSNKSYNKHICYLKAVITRLVDWEIIENNPASKITTLPVDETQKYIPYTDAERKAIQEYLFIHHYRFFVFLMFVYHGGIRPKEILSLKVKNIDLINMQISILPDMKAENSKTRKIRKIPISNVLHRFIREMELPSHDRECYVFGSPYQAGRGNSGSSKGRITGAMHPEYFKPSKTKVKRDTVTKLWKTLIKDQLGVDKYLYAAKHSGADAKILAGIDIDTLQELYGHSSKLMTEKYATAIKKVRFNEIIEKSPEF